MQKRERHLTMTAYHWALLWLAILVVLCAATWSYELWGKPSGVSVTLPIGPGRQLHANLWKPGPGYVDADFNRGMLITRHGPPNIMVWYQDQSSMLQLGSLKLVTWPLLLLTASIALLAGSLRVHNLRRLSRTH